MIVGEALAEVGKMLDDPSFVHTEAGVAMTQLSRAQEWVALRYELLRQTVSLTLTADISLYHLPSRYPRMKRLVAVDWGSKTLFPMNWKDLQVLDTQWIAHTQALRYYYLWGITYLGFFPVPDANEIVNLTMVVTSQALTTGGQSLEVPNSYLPSVIRVAAGILRVILEHDPAGIKMVQEGLGVARGAG